ncbi:hypothetical protein [Pseudomonas songnenensis]|uniref:Uncharacterized protein n=1 Tax=Pseudomonas songnenensis TaxID=1176259 RepID=A0A482UAB7_9PSED|nr:hypothetical protein [Pseudomonas songnenensis]RYJ59195.1 hypothetical protein EJA06_022050 [Pseudomonas songnenensis]
MAKIKFTRRPSSVLAEHRPIYKMAQTLVIIELCGRGKKCSLIKLHLLNWALKSRSRIELLQHAVRSKSLHLPVWGFDPSLAISLQLSIEDGLLEIEGSGVSVTDKGCRLLEEIMKNGDFLKTEKESLNLIGKGITETMVSAAAKGWE